MNVFTKVKRSETIRTLLLNIYIFIIYLPTATDE